MKYLFLILASFFLSFRAFASIAPINGDADICMGGHTNLTDATTGGTWSSSNMAIATVNSAGRVYGVAAGIATITYAVAAGFVTVMATISAPPNVYTVLGGGSGCPNGQGVSISINGSDVGVFYSIYLLGGTGLGSIGYGGTGAAMTVGYATVSGSYVVFASDNATNCNIEMNNAVLVTMDPMPSMITGPDTMCAGSIVVLSDSVSGGIWSSAYPGRATVDSLDGEVTGVIGNATIIYTLSTGCSIDKTIWVEDIAEPTITYNWQTATLYATPGYSSYQWYDSLHGLISGATSPSIAALYTEYYYVIAGNNNNCTRPSALFHFNADELSVTEQTDDERIQIYPNPATNLLTISATNKITSIVITDLIGQVVYKHDYYNADIRSAQVNIADLPTGVYFAKINGSQVDKFIKK